MENQRVKELGEWGTPGRPEYNLFIGRMGNPRPWEQETHSKLGTELGWVPAVPGAQSGLFPAHLTKHRVKVMAGDEGN